MCVEKIHSGQMKAQLSLRSTRELTALFQVLALPIGEREGVRERERKREREKERERRVSIFKKRMT